LPIKNVFRSFVKLCDKIGLYEKELISIDGSKFIAVNSKDNNFNEKKACSKNFYDCG
jgi:transposase